MICVMRVVHKDTLLPLADARTTTAIFIEKLFSCSSVPSPPRTVPLCMRLLHVPNQHT